MNQGFEAVDRRFEAVDRRFEAVDGRFEQVEHLIDEKTRENGVLIEGLQRQVQAVAEGVNSAQETAIRLHGETQRQLAEIRATVRVTHSQVDTRVTVLEIQMSKLDQRLSSVEAEMIHGRQ